MDCHIFCAHYLGIPIMPIYIQGHKLSQQRIRSAFNQKIALIFLHIEALMLQSLIILRKFLTQSSRLGRIRLTGRCHQRQKNG